MKKFIILSSMIVLVAASCNNNTVQTQSIDQTKVDTSLKISSLAPASAIVNTAVTIHGQGFTSTGNQIMFGDPGTMTRPDGSPANIIDTVVSADGKTLSFTVPTQGPSGILCSSPGHCVGVTAKLLQPGSYNVSVKNQNGTSNVLVFTVK